MKPLGVVAGWLVAFFLFVVDKQVKYTGVNLAGAEFGEIHLPGTIGQDFTYPTTDEVDYFCTEKNMNIIRIPFLWERLQEQLYASFDMNNLNLLKTIVDYALSCDCAVILDPHNYGRYYNQIIGHPDVPVTAFVDFWETLASEFMTRSNVIFGLMNQPYGLMNEPFDNETEQWLENANAAIAGIRNTGAENLILVPGNAWSGAHSWLQNDWYGKSNAEVMINIDDPLDNFAFEMHQFFNNDYTGFEFFFFFF